MTPHLILMKKVTFHTYRKTGEYKIVKNSNINKNETRLNNKEISLSQKLKNNLLKVIESFDQDIV